MTGTGGAGLGRPLEAREFAPLMAALGPLEGAPHLAVGVSGGADSLALCLLLHDWLSARGGTLSALTVDHGLRPESAREAAWVGRTLRRLGIAHRTLAWREARPAANVQAAARRARYALMTAWCEARGVLHLALAHHREDQAETWLLRLGRGSGLDGLAAMAPVSESPSVRLLRPLLGVPKARLEATLAARALTWVEDPSNRDPLHARVRVRALMPGLAAQGMTAERLGATAANLGRARAALAASLTRLLLEAVKLHPAGFAVLDPRAVAGAPDELALRALARVLASVGGLDYAPRLVRLERLLARLRAGLAAGTLRGATLGGCRLAARSGGGLLVVRETAGLASCPLVPGEAVLWDGRFEVAAAGPGGPGSLCVASLGAEGWAEVRHLIPRARTRAIPAPARPALPALREGGALVAVPHLGYWHAGGPAPGRVMCRFAPQNSLAPGGFTVA